MEEALLVKERERPLKRAERELPLVRLYYLLG